MDSLMQGFCAGLFISQLVAMAFIGSRALPILIINAVLVLAISIAGILGVFK